MRDIPPLYAHQHTSVLNFLKSQVGYDASDPGTGKTRVHLEVFSARHKRDNTLRALVLAPKSILRAAWERDAFQYTPHLRVSVATALDREKAFAREADVYVTNTDAVKWLATKPASFFKKFDTLIVDEATAFKHHTSQRSRALNKIKKYFKHRYALSGTPNSNSICDLWNQYNFLDNGQRLGKSFFQFRNSTCTPVQIGPQPNMVEWRDKPNIEAIVGQIVADITIRHKLEDCLDLPELVITPMIYQMTLKQFRAYEQMRKQAVAVLNGDTVLSAVNAASVNTKILQIASGAVYTEEGEYTVIDTERYEMALELIEGRKHTIVFYSWDHQLDQMEKLLKNAGISYAVINGSVSDKLRNQITQEFQAGFYRVILAHPKSAAHGFTWTRATTTLWLNPVYDLEWWTQGNRRFYRAGQTLPTEVIVLIAENTIEEQVFARLMGKGDRMASMLEFLQGALTCK